MQNMVNEVSTKSVKSNMAAKIFKILAAVMVVLLLSVTSAFASEYLITPTDTESVEIGLNEHRTLCAPPVESGSYVYTWSYCAGVFQDLAQEQEFAYINLPVKQKKTLEVDASMVQQYQISPNLAKFRCLVSDIKGQIVAEQIFKVTIKSDPLTAAVATLTQPSQTSTLDSDSSTAVDYYDLRQDKNADSVIITVKYQDEKQLQLSEDTIAEVEVGKDFKWSIQFKEFLGQPTKVEVDNTELLATADQLTGNLVIYPADSAQGISQNSVVTATYSASKTGYLINLYTQDANGVYNFAGVRDGSEGMPGDSIPSQTDLDSLKQEFEIETGGVYYLETYTSGQITQDGSSSVEVIFARNIVSMSFDPNEGINGPDTIYGRIGQDVPRESIIPPHYAGYTFNGWKENEGETAGELPQQFPNYSSTYIADWQPPQEGDLKQVHIVYWGEKAERDESHEFQPEEFDYIGEKTIDNVPYHTNPEEKWWPSEAYWLPHNEKGEIYHNYEKYWVTQPEVFHSDGAVFVRADNLTVFNIYYLRKHYTIKFLDSRSWYPESLGDIDAKWDQDISQQFEDITERTYGEGKSSAPWETEDNPNTCVNLLTHMPDNNRNYYKHYLPEDTVNLYYFLQEPYAERLTPEVRPLNPQEQTAGYETKYIANLEYLEYIPFIQSPNVISSDEFIPIYGFTTPDDDDMYAPELETEIDRNLGMYYKRNTWTLSLVSCLGSTPTDPAVYITDAPFDLSLDQIRIPDNVPGIFIGDGQHILANYIPENPNIEVIDKNYVFKGWTTDMGGTVPINLEEYKMPNSGFNIYAIWEAPGDITLNFNQTSDPANPESTASTDKVEHQTYNKHPERIVDAKTFTDYEFISWYYYKSESDRAQGIKTYFTEDLLVPGHDIDLYPEYRYIGTNKYIIHYVRENQEHEYEDVASPTEGIGIIGQTYTVQAKTTNQLYLDYRIFYTPTKLTDTITVGKKDDPVSELYFIYVPSEDFHIDYQVRYLYASGDEEIAWTEDKQTVTNKTMVTVNANIKDGYLLFENEPSMKTVTLYKGEEGFINYIDFLVTPLTRQFTYQCDKEQGEVHLRVLEPTGEEHKDGDVYSVTETVYDDTVTCSGAEAAPAKGYKLTKWVMLDDSGQEVDVPESWLKAKGIVVLPTLPEGKKVWGKNYTFIAKFEVKSFSVDFFAYPEGDGRIECISGEKATTLEYGTKYKKVDNDKITVFKKGSDTEELMTMQAVPESAGKIMQGWYISNDMKDVKTVPDEGIIEDTSYFIANFSTSIYQVSFTTEPHSEEFLINESQEVTPLNVYFGASISVDDTGQLTIDYETPASKYLYGSKNIQASYVPSTTNADYHFEKWVAIVDEQEQESLPSAITGNTVFKAVFVKTQYLVSFDDSEPAIVYTPDFPEGLTVGSGTSYSVGIEPDGKKGLIDITEHTTIEASYQGEFEVLTQWNYSEDGGLTWIPITDETDKTIKTNIIFKLSHAPYNVNANLNVLSRCEGMGTINTEGQIELGSDYLVSSSSEYRVIPDEASSNNTIWIKYDMPDFDPSQITVNCVAEASPGYKFSYWAIVEGETVTPINPSEDPWRIHKDTNIRAVFEEAIVPVTFATSDSSQGFVDESSYDEAYVNSYYSVETNEDRTESSIYIQVNGENVLACTASAIEGYRITKWMLNNHDIPTELEDRKLSATNSFVVYFQKGRYTASFDLEHSHYSFKPEAPESFVDIEAFSRPVVNIVEAETPDECHYGIYFGNDPSKEVLVKPNDGYKFLNFIAVEEDGNTVTLNDDYIITKNITIFAKVEGMGRKLTFEVAPDSLNHGRVTVSSLGVGTEGATYEIFRDKVVITDNGETTEVTALPDEGYEFSEWEVAAPENNSTYKTSYKDPAPIDSNLIFLAHFQSYNVNVQFSADGADINPVEYQFVAGTTFTTYGQESDPIAKLEFDNPEQTEITAEAYSGYYFSEWMIKYNEEEDFQSIKQEDKKLLERNVWIKAVYTTKQFTCEIVSADTGRGSIDPSGEAFEIVSGTKISVSDNKVSVGMDDYYAVPGNLYKFSTWTYSLAGGVETPFTEGEIVIESSILIRAYFVCDNVRYSFYYNDDYSTLSKNGNNSNKNFEDNGMTNIDVDALSYSTFTFEDNKISVRNEQDPSKSFQITTDIKPGIIGYDFDGWYTCDETGAALKGPLTGQEVFAGDSSSNKIVAVYANSGVKVKFLPVIGCEFDPPAKEITVKTDSIGAIYEDEDHSLTFKLSSDSDYKVKAIVSPGYNFLSWVETDSSGVTEKSIPAEGIKISTESYFKPKLDTQQFIIEFSTNPESSGDITWEHGGQIPGGTKVSLGLDNSTLCFMLPDEASTIYNATVRAHSGFIFDHWQITCGGTERTLPIDNIDGDIQCVAVFSFNTRVLNLSVLDDVGGTISCGTGNFDVAYNSMIEIGDYNSLIFTSKNSDEAYYTVTATPQPDSQYKFSKWEYNDGGSWQVLDRSISMSSDINIRAVFEVSVYFNLNITAVNGTVEPSQVEVKAKSTFTTQGPQLSLSGGGYVNAQSDGYSSWSCWQYLDESGNWQSIDDGSVTTVNDNMSIRAYFEASTINLSFVAEPDSAGNIYRETLEVKQHSNVSTHTDENRYYIDFSRQGETVSNYFEVYSEYSFKCWQYRLSSSDNWVNIDEGMTIDQNNTEFRALADKDICTVHLYHGQGGTIEPERSDSITVVKGSHYVYKASNQSLHFDNIGEGQVADFYGKPDDDRYVVNTWNSVSEGVYTPLADGSTGTIDSDCDFGVDFNAKINFTTAGEDIGWIDFNPQRTTEIVCHLGSSLSFMNETVGFYDIWSSSEQYATFHNNPGYTFSKWVAYNGETPVGTPSTVDCALTIIAYCDLGTFNISFDNGAISQFGKVVPESLSVEAKSTISFEDVNSCETIIFTSKSAVTTSATVSENEGYDVSGWEYYDTDGWKPLTLPWEITSEMVLKPSFNNTGVNVTFESSDPSAGNPSVELVPNVVTGSTYSYDPSRTALIFNTIEGYNWEVFGQAESGYTFVKWMVYDPSKQAYVDIPSQEYQRVVVAGLKFRCQFDVFNCDLSFLAEPNNAGRIDNPQGLQTICTQSSIKLVFNELYFTDFRTKQETKITALSNDGYEFIKWQYSENSGEWKDFDTSQDFKILVSNLSIKAIFNITGFKASFSVYPEGAANLNTNMISPITNDSQYYFTEGTSTYSELWFDYMGDQTNAYTQVSIDGITAGYEFDAWYIKSGGQLKKVIDLTQEERVMDADHEFVAQFNTYDCLIQPQVIESGGSYIGPSSDFIVASKSVVNIETSQIEGHDNSAVHFKSSSGEDTSLTAQSNTGYQFVCWKILDDDGTSWIELYDNYEVINKNILIKPIFSNIGVDVSFEADSGVEVVFPTDFRAQTDSIYTYTDKELKIINNAGEEETITHDIQTPGFYSDGWKIKIGDEWKDIPTEVSERVITEPLHFKLVTQRSISQLAFKVNEECREIGKVEGAVEIGSIDSSYSFTYSLSNDGKAQVYITSTEKPETYSVSASGINAGHVCVGCTMETGSGKRLLKDQETTQVLEDATFEFYFAAGKINLHFEEISQGAYFDNTGIAWNASAMPEMYVKWASRDSENLFANEDVVKDGYLVFSLEESAASPYAIVYAGAKPSYVFTGWEYKTEVGAAEYEKLTKDVAVSLESTNEVWVRPTFDTYNVDVKAVSNNTQKGTVTPTAAISNVVTRTGFTVTSEGDKSSKITLGNGEVIEATANQGYHFDHWGIQVGSISKERELSEDDTMILDTTLFTAYFSSFPISLSFNVETVGTETAGGYFDLEPPTTSTTLNANSMDTYEIKEAETSLSESVFTLNSTKLQRLKAKANQGYHFDGWYIGEEKLTAGILYDNTTITAKFTTFDASVKAKAKTGQEKWGTIEQPVDFVAKTFTGFTVNTSSDYKNSTINFEDPDKSTITATPYYDKGYVFDHWNIKIGSQDEVPYDPDVHKTIIDDTIFIAVFKTHPVVVSFVTNSSSMGCFENKDGSEVQSIILDEVQTTTEFICNNGQGTSDAYFYFKDGEKDKTTIHAHSYAGYHFAGWKMDDQQEYVKQGKILKETTFMAVFDYYDATVKFTAEDDKGTIEGGEEHLVKTHTSYTTSADPDETKGYVTTKDSEGKDFTVTATAKKGYHFKRWHIYTDVHSAQSNDEKGSIIGNTRFVAEFIPYKCTLNVYGENARMAYGATSGNEELIFSADVYTITNFVPKGIFGAIDSSLTYTNTKDIKVTKYFKNKGYYAFKEWQRKDDSGKWVKIESGDDTTIYGNTDLKVVYAPYDCKLMFETNSLPGSDLKLGEVKACEGSSIPTSVKSTTTYTVGIEGIMKFTEPETNNVYEVVAVPSQGYHFAGWNYSNVETDGIVTKDMTFTANFEPNEDTPYTVIWMFQDANDDPHLSAKDKNYIEFARHTYYGPTASYTREYIEDVKFFHEDGIIKPTNYEITQIKGDGSTIIYVYFDRVAVHLITKDSFEDQDHFKEFMLNDRVEPRLYGCKVLVNSLIKDKAGDQPEHELLDFMYANKDYQEVMVGFRDTKIEFLYNELAYHIDYSLVSPAKGTIEPVSEECKVLTGQPTGATLTPATGEALAYWKDNSETQIGTDLHVVPNNPWYDKYHQDGKLVLGNNDDLIAKIFREGEEESRIFDMKSVYAVMQSDLPVPPGPTPDPDNPGGGGSSWNSTITGDDLMMAAMILLVAFALTGGLLTIRLIVKKRK